MLKMQALLIERQIVRESIDSIFLKSNDLVALRNDLGVLRDRSNRLDQINEDFRNLKLQKNATPEDWAREYKDILQYSDKINKMFEMASYNVSLHQNLEKDLDQESTSTGELRTSMKGRLKLPKIEIEKYDGSPGKWIQFYGQFERIHKDDTLDAVDKYYYLKQFCEEGSPIKEIIDTFQPTDEGYAEAVEMIKERFGKRERLIEFYVRKLLHLVLRQSASESLPLSEIVRDIEGQVRALGALGMDVEMFSPMLVPLVEATLPSSVLVIWQRERPETDKTLLKLLLDFLKKEVAGQERVRVARESFKDTESNVPTAAALVMTGKPIQLKLRSCLFCEKDDHGSSSCQVADKLTLDERRGRAIKNRACFRCLKVGHRADRCYSREKCAKCEGAHATLICFKKEIVQTCVAHCAEGPVLLQTLNALINGKKARVLFDGASQGSYVRENFLTGMKIEKKKACKLRHGVFGGTTTDPILHNVYNLKLQSMRRGKPVPLDIMGVKGSICGAVPVLLEGTIVEKLKREGIFLSDDGGEIDVLLGADVIPSIFSGETKRIEGLLAMNSKLGWTVMGSVDSSQSCVSLNISLLQLEIPTLWELDVIGIQDPIRVLKKEEEERVRLAKFSETVRVKEGRYVVALPWKEGHEKLKDNKNMARSRLEKMSKRLTPELFHEYDQILKDWEEEGIIEEVAGSSETGIYLPHRPVVKESSSSTRVRPVFDASASGPSGVSLNQCLEKGDNLLEVIPTVLTRFRENKVGVASDIRKAFLQIEVREEDREWLQFLWWEDGEKKNIKVYRHCRVVFGLTCSPFLLRAIINLHLDCAPEELKDTAKKLCNSFYMDEAITSVESLKELEVFKAEANDIMKKGSFELTKWVWSGKEQESVAVLGVGWSPVEDTMFVRPPSEYEGIVTKRKLLSIAQSCFDPLGLVSPVLLKPKLLLKEVWAQKSIGWDEELNEDVCKELSRWQKDVQLLSMCHVPRYIGGGGGPQELHIFCDASQDAYAACAYLRTGDAEVKVSLIQSKVRITPPTLNSIPRAELMAATLGSRLNTAVQKAIEVDQVFMWTDSMVVLNWLQKTEGWSVFVNNRVKEIVSSTELKWWKHVPGIKNIADIPSRGLTVKQLIQSEWFKGPSWLYESPDLWPESEMIAVPEAKKEQKKVAISLVVSEINGVVDKLNEISCFSKMKRVVAYMCRWLPSSQERGNIRAQELENAEKRIWRMLQDRVQIQSGQEVFVDEEGLMRMRSKVTTEQFSFCNPIVLPGKEVVVECLIEETHRRLSHAGVGTVMANLREHYWITKARQVVRKIVKRCVSCKRYKSKGVQPPFCSLPPSRTQLGKIWSVVGCDLAGPLFLRNQEKIWVTLFTCATYRAVHLEVVSNLTTGALIMALRRFCARRGRVQKIYSDQGTNLVGAKNLLDSIEWQEIEQYCTGQKIEWVLNVPSAPWWGGFFERMVRTVKETLRKSLGRASLSKEELETILCEVENVVNQRPLTYFSEQDELVPLTPALFLYEASTGGLPEFDLIDEKVVQGRAKYLQDLRKDLRVRFRVEYLSRLTHFGNRQVTDLKVGDIVLIQSDDKKRLEWPLGKVIELIPGRDDLARTARLRTQKGELVRPFQRLHRLEVSAHTDFDNREPTLEETPVFMEESGGEDQLEEGDEGVLDEVEEVMTRRGRKVQPPRRLDL